MLEFLSEYTSHAATNHIGWFKITFRSSTDLVNNYLCVLECVIDPWSHWGSQHLTVLKGNSEDKHKLNFKGHQMLKVGKRLRAWFCPSNDKLETSSQVKLENKRESWTWLAETVNPLAYICCFYPLSAQDTLKPTAWR